MPNKNYPKVVVLKKSIMTLAIVSIVFIVLLIVHNLYQSSTVPAGKLSTDEATVQSVATVSDTTWYQNEIPPPPDDSLKNRKNDPEIKQTSAEKFIQPEDNEETIQNNRDELKAMSAPIISNQLLAKSDETTNSALSDKDIKNTIIKDDDYLDSELKNPKSPYELQAGTLIPGVLITGINSDLPGQLTGQVRSNVYDSISGEYLLIPQGAKLIGAYDAKIAYGQERVLIVWQRIIFPNGQSIDLEGMAGVDMSGYAGFHDEVDNHYRKIFGSVILMSVLSAGAQLSQPQNNNDNWQAPSVGQTMAQGLGTNLLNTGTMITEKNINIQPTLEIRPGYEFNINVTKDIVFKRPYEHA